MTGRIAVLRSHDEDFQGAKNDSNLSIFANGSYRSAPLGVASRNKSVGD